MRSIVPLLLAAGAALVSTSALAEETSPLITGGIDLKSGYVLDDALVSTDGPVLQGFISVNVTDKCSLDAWGSKGLDRTVGDEIDLGASCRFDLGQDFKAEVVVSRYLLLGGVPDMTEVTVGLSKGPVDLSVGHYFWSGGLQSATRVQFGYNTELAAKLSARAEVTYETGFDLKDTIVLGADLKYAITDKLSLGVTGYAPVIKSGGNDYKVVASLSMSF